MKKCNVCGQSKPLDEFYKNATYADGHEGRCKECRKKYQVEWREENRDEHRQYSREYGREHRGERAAYYKDWRSENVERKAEYDAEWKRNHPERMKDRRRVENAKRRARTVNAGGSYTADEWEALKHKYGCKCLLCGRAEPEVKITPDHVIPLASGGSNTIDNIQPLCWSCNARKQNRIADYR